MGLARIMVIGAYPYSRNTKQKSIPLKAGGTSRSRLFLSASLSSVINVSDTPPAPKFNGKAQEVAEKVLQSFRQPSRLPAALAPVFIRRNNAIPCNAWSWGNRLIVSLHGHTDARGYRQWQKVHRFVREGERAIHILAPIMKKIEKEDQEKFVTVGFKATPVFGLEQTDGEPLQTGDSATDAWLASLPLREVAEEWGLTIETFNGRHFAPLGSFRPGRIALGVQNAATWCHELVHAADHRNGNLTEYGQHWRSETVAELGGAILLKMLRQDAEADLGGCWRYITGYSKSAGVHPLTACQRVLKRTCEAICLILDTAERLKAQAA
jgi:hypothetical protein